MQAYGADVILTDPMDGIRGAIDEVRQLSLADPTLLYVEQYNNPANWHAHYWTTAPHSFPMHYVAPIHPDLHSNHPEKSALHSFFNICFALIHLHMNCTHFHALPCTYS